MRKLLAGAALGILALTPLQADPGGGHGGGHGGGPGGGQGGGAHGGGPAGGHGNGGGNPHGNPGIPMQSGSAHGSGNGRINGGREAARGPVMHGPSIRPQQAEVRRQVEVRRDARAMRSHGPERADRGNAKHQPVQVEARTVVRDVAPVARSSGVIPNRVVTASHAGPVHWRGREARGFVIDGCPPGLAKKNNGCMPPGLARTAIVATAPWRQPSWYGADWYGDRYRYYDGYMLRMGPDDRVLGYVPLLGGALAVGEAWPEDYQPVALPDYYRTFYDLGPADSYRYYDDTIYGVDPGDDLITSVIALLTGDSFDVGDVLPAGYDVYNVPYDYRDQYADGPDAIYRYSDGYVYEVDPQTRLIQAAIQLLTA